MTDQKADLKYWIALSHFSKFGPVRFKKLIVFFPSMREAWNASLAELKQSGIEEAVANEFLAVRLDIDPDRTVASMDKEGIKAMLIGDKDYPRLLSEIYDPPPILYYKGELKREEAAIAVVGTRKYSLYGKQAAEQFAFELAANGLAVTSGLALGIDSLAHTAALAAVGRTIAVLGSGLDRQNIYPGANRYLADKIVAEGGAILSEHTLGTPPLRHHFPQRNRIVSGLSLGVLVIEAPEKSGSLITARAALDQNREVFVVPGSIYSRASAGCNMLLQQGAMPVVRPADILAALDLMEVTAYTQKEKIADVTPEEGQVLSFLNQEPLHIDEIVRRSALPTPIVSSALVMMEIKGRVRNLGGMMYVLAR